MRIFLAIAHYNRPDMLRALLDDIERERNGYVIETRVYDDGTPAPNRTNYKGANYCRWPDNGGKTLFWSRINRILIDAKGSRLWDRFLLLPDDVRLVDGFFERLETTWQIIRDQRKVCLNPLIDGRGHAANWTKVESQLLRFGPIEVYRTGWTDCTWYAERRFVDAVGRIKRPPHNRWRKQYISTGVGDQMSKRLHRHGWGMYQVAETLLIHGKHPSMMHRTPYG